MKPTACLYPKIEMILPKLTGYSQSLPLVKTVPN